MLANSEDISCTTGSDPNKQEMGKYSSGSRIEMGGPRCKIFSHGPMFGAGGQRSCLVHIFIRER